VSGFARRPRTNRRQWLFIGLLLLAVFVVGFMAGFVVGYAEGSAG
jgi:uncharacterized membrane protein